MNLSIARLQYLKVQVGNDQEKVQSEISTPKNKVGETKLTIRHYIL